VAWCSAKMAQVIMAQNGKVGKNSTFSILRFGVRVGSLEWEV